MEPEGEGHEEDTWTLLFWCGPSYLYDTARLSWWSVSSITPPMSLGWPLQVTIDRDPTGTYSPGTTWWIPLEATGISTDPIACIDFGNIQATLLMTDAEAASNGVQITFGRIVPEPSGIAALLCGLVGLFGLLPRRKR